MNDKNAIRVEVKLSLSKTIPPISSDSPIEFGNYQLCPIPSSNLGKGEMLIKFDSRYKDPIGGASHPVGEIDIILKLLSLFFEADIKRDGVRLNNQDIPTGTLAPKNQYPHFSGAINLDGLGRYIEKVSCLDEDLARQYIRACHAYSFSLNFIPSDPTFAFFLLVVSVECMSSQNAIIPSSELNIDSNKCERFCRFIMTYLPESCKSADEHNEELFKELLKTAYYAHRSGFVHGGKEVSSASIMADKANSSYFKHAPEGKEVKTPGLRWFSHVVRSALLGWIEVAPLPPKARVDQELIARLAFEKAGLRLKAKRDVKKGEPVTFDDIDYR